MSRAVLGGTYPAACGRFCFALMLVVIRRQNQKPSGGIWPQNLVVIRRAAGGQNLSGGFQNSSGGVGQRAGNRAKFAPICKNSAFSDRSHRPITRLLTICSITAPDFLARSRRFCL
jgi:hypothetical protein